MSLKSLTMDELLTNFHPDVHDKIRELAKRSGVSHIVLFQNQMMDSSAFGERSALAIGPGCTHKTLQEVEGQHLGDLPSQRKHAVAYVETA